MLNKNPSRKAPQAIRSAPFSKLGPSAPASTPLVRRQMQGNRSVNTAPELAFRRGLWDANLRGYRTHWKKAPGSPDVAFVGRRIAIFVMGCFWHRCRRCRPSTPRTNAEWWQQKFNRTLERDRRTRRTLRRSGWSVIDVWECQIKRDLLRSVERVAGAIERKI